MAKTKRFREFGMDVIARHDYEDKTLQEKLKTYQQKSYDSFKHFLTNVPNFEYGRFLDVGCGDDYIVAQADEDFGEGRGIDLLVDEGQYKNVDVADWYQMARKTYKKQRFNAVFINHSLEHAANVYALMQQVSALQSKDDAIFVAVPDGNAPFGYSITSSTTHFSCITEGYLRTTLQRFGYNCEVERREFRPGAPELWAYGIKQYKSFPLK